MNLLAPVRDFMTKKLITVNPKDPLILVRELFEKNNIHHLPVVRYKKIVGMISKTDLLFFQKGLRREKQATKVLNEIALHNYCAEDIMTTALAKLEPDDRLNVALEVFKLNKFHALPVLENEELVGMLTTYDIIAALAKEPVAIQ